jgi:hypothetical protein
MNDIVAHTLSAYTSALDAAANANVLMRTTNTLLENTSPQVNEDVPLSLVVIKDASNKLSPTDKRRGRVSPIPNVNLPLKKTLSVRWKDQSNRENAFSNETLDEEMLKVETDEDVRDVSNPLISKPKKRSPSPPHLDIKEYEQRMKKLKTSIGDACKLELKFLNQAKHVRDKRMRMVERLKHMKRKAQRFNVLNAQRGMMNDSNSTSEMDVATTKLPEGNVTDDDDFVLPPVYQEKSTKKQSSSNFIDMTQ